MDAALVSFRDTFSGEIVLPDDSGYDSARAVWNGMIDRRPALVVKPRDNADVAAAIRLARDADLVIAVRSGGHSIPGLSTCDGGIVIDLSAIRGARVDPERRVARVNGGSLLGELDDAAQSVGLVCPVGVVSHTGVAGLTLGGGMGRLQRRFGLTIDNLQAVELVTADGQVVRADEHENAELLWGLRGAGANFGIVTAFEFGLHPLDNPVTHGTVTHPIERAAELAAHFREAMESGPGAFWASFGLGLSEPAENGREPVAQVSVLHSGVPEDAERDLAPLRQFGPPAADTIAVKPYLETQRLYDEDQAWGHRFYMGSAFLPELSDQALALCVEHIAHIPRGAECGITMWACGGAIAEVPDGAAAFTGRDAAVWLSAEAMWDDSALDDDCRAWARGVMAALKPFTSQGRYVNDVADARTDLRTIYGEAKHDRLVALKRAWDPDNVFRLNLNVMP